MNIDWSFLVPFLSLVGGIAGAWVGVKVNITRLETKMEMVEERLESVHKRTHRHSNDLLIHDMEIEQALGKLDLPRVRRQQVQE
jgi:hypothetical protein